MLNVYICEDNPAHLEYLSKVLSNAIMIRELDMKLALSTNDPYELLSAVENNMAMSAYFLDIDLQNNMSGLQLAVKLRELDPRGFIVFITSHFEMSFLTFQYKVEALDFIIKDMDFPQNLSASNIAEKISNCLMNIQQKYSAIDNNAHKSFVTRIRDTTIVEPYENILFFEVSSNSKKIMMHALNRHVEFHSTLKEIENLVDGRFYRCKDSCIVNKDLIVHIDAQKRIIRMVNGECCATSVRMMKGLLNSLK